MDSVRCWTEREPFAWHGKYFHYDRVVIWPRPLQQPHPPIVFPADSEDGLTIAARRRVPSGTAYRSMARTKATLDRFRALAAENGWTPAPEDCLLVRNVYVSETNERARLEVEPHLEYFWQKLLSYHRGSMKLMGVTPPQRPAVVQRAEEVPFFEFDFELCQKEGITIIGDPDYVIREIKAQTQELGVGVFIALLHFGSMPHALATKNMRLFGEKVLPELKRA